MIITKQGENIDVFVLKNIIVKLIYKYVYFYKKFREILGTVIISPGWMMWHLQGDYVDDNGYAFVNFYLHCKVFFWKNLFVIKLWPWPQKS